VYRSLSGNYDGSIVVGFISVWTIWYIRYEKLKKIIKNDIKDIDWYTLPVQRNKNYSLLFVSLVAVMLLCKPLLTLLNELDNEI
jgi:hypothetical protein